MNVYYQRPIDRDVKLSENRWKEIKITEKYDHQKG